jgi:ATPase subunit of ABC transporter with duplicated ATPase domains
VQQWFHKSQMSGKKSSFVMAVRILQNVNPMSEILRAKNLVRNSGRKIVVGDADIDVYGAEIVRLVGPNNAGKTTIFA